MRPGIAGAARRRQERRHAEHRQGSRAARPAPPVARRGQAAVASAVAPAVDRRRGRRWPRPGGRGRRASGCSPCRKAAAGAERDAAARRRAELHPGRVERLASARCWMADRRHRAGWSGWRPSNRARMGPIPPARGGSGHRLARQGRIGAGGMEQILTKQLREKPRRISNLRCGNPLAWSCSSPVWSGRLRAGRWARVRRNGVVQTMLITLPPTTVRPTTKNS